MTLNGWTKGAVAAVLMAASSFMAGPAVAEVKIGFNVPLTGFAASDGKSALAGAKLAIEQANAAGGVSGKTLELVVYDDQASPKDVVPVITKLIEQDRVVVGVSGSYSGSTRAAASIFQAAKVPYVTAYAIHPEITLAGDYNFRVSFMGEVQGRAGARLVKDLGRQNVVLITLQNDFGLSLAAGFKEAAPGQGVRIVNEYEYGMKDSQFGPIISKIKADNPDIIYATGYFFTAGPLVAQLRSAGITAPIIGQEGYDSEEFIKIAGPASEGVYVTTSLDRDSTSPVTRAFIDAFMKANGAGPDMVAAASYTAVMVAVEGLRKTGGNGGSALRDAIAAGKFDMPTGMLSFNDLHEVAKDVQVQIVRDKAFHRHSIISDPVLLAPPTRTKK